MTTTTAAYLIQSNMGLYVTPERTKRADVEAAEVFTTRAAAEAVRKSMPYPHLLVVREVKLTPAGN
jgi:hypothetical protein